MEKWIYIGKYTNVLFLIFKINENYGENIFNKIQYPFMVKLLVNYLYIVLYYLYNFLKLLNYNSRYHFNATSTQY